MEAFLIIVLFVLVVIQWFVSTGRMDKLEDRVTSLTGERQDLQQIISLTQRVHALESEVQRLKAQPAPVPAPAAVPFQQPAARPVVAPVPVPVPTPVVVHPPQPVAIPVVQHPPQPPTAPFVSPPPLPVVGPAIPPAAAFAPAKARATQQEWEAIVGGNWLLKVGVIVL